MDVRLRASAAAWQYEPFGDTLFARDSMGFEDSMCPIKLNEHPHCIEPGFHIDIRSRGPGYFRRICKKPPKAVLEQRVVPMHVLWP
jgi:hypothetical protein